MLYDSFRADEKAGTTSLALANCRGLGAGVRGCHRDDPAGHSWRAFADRWAGDSLSAIQVGRRWIEMGEAEGETDGGSRDAGQRYRWSLKAGRRLLGAFIKIDGMPFRVFFRSAVLLLFLVSTLFTSAQTDRRGRKYKAPPPTMKIDILVVRASSGKPIPNAAVIFHPVNDKGKSQGDMELKTDLDGKTTLDVIPIGSTVRLQVIAHGFQTFGNDYIANADAKQITIKMLKPTEQYSIYKGNGTGDQSGQAKETTEKPQSSEKPD